MRTGMPQEPDIDEPNRVPSPRIGFAARLTLAYLLVGGYQIFHHVPWLDEWQAWLLARDAHSLAELFHSLYYETHPPLWHLCLYAITRFTHDVRAMQAFHLALASLGVFVVAAWAPLSRWQAVFYAFGYFIFYEYGAISREYVLGVVLTMIAAIMLRRFCRSLLFYLVLALLAQSEPYGIVLAASLAVGAIAHLLWEWKQGRSTTSRQRLMIGAGLLILIVSLVAAFIQTMPSPECTYVNRDRQLDAGKALSNILRTFANFPDLDEGYVWNRNFFDSSFLYTRDKQVGLSVVILAMFALVFSKRPVGLITLALGTAGTLAALYLSDSQTYRHTGHLFVVWTAAYCIAEQSAPVRLKFLARADALRRNLFSAILFLQLIPALFAFVMERQLPLSASRDAAAYIRKRFPADIPIVMAYDLSGPALSGCLNRPLFYATRREYGTFLLWDGLRIQRRSSLVDVRRLQNETGHDVLLILARRVPQDFLPTGPDVPKLIPIADFSETIDLCDRYAIYLAPFGQSNEPATRPASSLALPSPRSK